MHALTLTDRLFHDIQKGHGRAAATVADVSAHDALAITHAGTTLPLDGAQTTRLRVRDLSDDQLISMRMGRKHDNLLQELRATGQQADMDTMVSYVTWERLQPITSPLATTFQSSHTAQSDAVVDDNPQIALHRLLAPIATAKIGQPIAIGLPYDADVLPQPAEDTSTYTIQVLGMGKTGPALSRLATLPAPFVDRVRQWAAYGIQTNDWNLALGTDALHRLSPYLQNPQFKATVFFFRDRAIALAHGPERLMAMALAADCAASAHHALATTKNMPAVLDALTGARLD